MPVFHLVLFGKWFALKQSTCFERCEWAKTLNLSGHSLCQCTYWLTEYSPFCPAFFSLPLGYCLLCSHLPLFTISRLLFFVLLCPPGSRGGVSEEDAGFRARCCWRMALRIQGTTLLPSPLLSVMTHIIEMLIWRSSLDELCSPRENHVWVLRLW